MLDSPGYDPPFYVDPSVTQNERDGGAGGWADPGAFEQVKEEPRIQAAKFKDDSGKPLNPRGRTGIAGRGLLGLWGPNLSVAVNLVRTNEATGELEILLGNKEGGQDLELPKGFVLPGEEPDEAVARVLESETGWRPSGLDSEVVFEGYTYDPRETDNAWVESRVSLIVAGSDLRRSTFRPGGEFDEVKWWPLEAETINRVPSGQARFVRESLTRLMEAGHLDKATAENLLTATG
jgi:ADP-ribose pyrophosphatase